MITHTRFYLSHDDRPLRPSTSWRDVVCAWVMAVVVLLILLG